MRLNMKSWKLWKWKTLHQFVYFLPTKSILKLSLLLQYVWSIFLSTLVFLCYSIAFASYYFLVFLLLICQEDERCHWWRMDFGFWRCRFWWLVLLLQPETNCRCWQWRGGLLQPGPLLPSPGLGCAKSGQGCEQRKAKLKAKLGVIT